MTTAATTFSAPGFGWCGLAGSGRGLKKIYLPEPDRNALLGRMSAEFPEVQFRHDCFSVAVQELLRFFRGEVPRFTCRLDYGRATGFQKKVWQAASDVKYGQVRTYGWLAARIGKPRCLRAVGTALGRNPLPIIIPCHRILRRDGGPGGFSATGGIALKKKLLELERIAL